ncbi:hypothetical protein N9L68_08255, partial [bacterium]|nr:hypothetical protein [bacterium]
GPWMVERIAPRAGELPGGLGSTGGRRSHGVERGSAWAGNPMTWRTAGEVMRHGDHPPGVDEHPGGVTRGHRGRVRSPACVGLRCEFV